MWKVCKNLWTRMINELWLILNDWITIIYIFYDVHYYEFLQ